MCFFGDSSRCFAHTEARVNSCTGLIGRFEIAQKRLLASCSDLLDISDPPELGHLRQHSLMSKDCTIMDEDKLAYQQELREQTIANRRTRHARQFPLSDNLMSLIFLVQADPNEQQRERFVSSMNIRQIAMPQYTYLQWKQLFVELFAVSCTGVADPNITHRKRSTFYVMEEGETEEGEYGFWVLDEETGEEGFTGLYTENEFWVLSAKGSYSKRRIYGRSFKKGRPKGYGQKGGQRSRPGFRPRSKGKWFAAWEDDQQDTAFWGQGKSKGKGKKGKT